MPDPGAIVRIAVAAITGSSLVFAAAASQTKPDPPPPPPDLEVLWQTEITAEGDSLAVTVGESLVFVASSGTGLTAYSPENGRPAWSSTLIAARSPVSADPNLAVLAEGSLRVLSQASGETVWSVAVAPEAAVVAAALDRFVVAAGRQLRAWKKDGTASWTSTPLSGNVITPLRVLNGVLYAGLDTPGLAAVDAANGSIRWQHAIPARPESLLVDDQRLYVSAVDEKLYAYPTSGDPSPDWRFHALRAIGQPASDGKHVYFALLDNSVGAFDRSGGSRRWSRGLASRPAAGPIRTGDRLVVALATGLVVELSAVDGRRVAPRSPPTLQPMRAQAVAPARDGHRIFTVTTGTDSTRRLWAWGRK